MKQVKFLEKLLDGAGVEWVPLGELGELVRGNGLQKKDFTESGVPAIHYGQIYTYYGLFTTTTKSFVSPETAKGLKKVNKGDVVITNTSENIDDVGKSLVYLGEQQAVTGGHATIFKPKPGVSGKYFAYFTQTAEFSSQKRKHAKGTKVIDVSATDMAKILIPIPCSENPEKSLVIQSEIARILDAFTALTSELTSELTTRKKQYEYYRDALLTFDTYTDSASKQVSNMQWINLSEVVEIRSGWGFPKTFQGKSSGAYPFYKVSDMNLVGNESLMKKSNNFIDEISAEKLGVTPAPAGTVIFPKIGAAIATNKKRLLSTPSAYDNNIMGLIPKDCIAPRFLFFWMQTVNLVELANDSGAVPSIRKSEMEKLKFPLLPIEKQNRIVAILDKFDTLTHSITEGLPREIALRQKQYAYYRDLLFNFPQPV